MFKFMESGWKPITGVSDLVLWDRREFISTADHAANVALDAMQDWSITDDDALQEAKAKDANIRASTDGAKRGSGQSAAGVAIMAYHRDGRRVLLHRSGHLLGNLQSAFLAEALAMELCFQTLAELFPT